uniref:Proteoglycan 4a n=1 Tax=Salarias fasciatus TaxID=181472 RepID=A0A672I3E1_SALFA
FSALWLLWLLLDQVHILKSVSSCSGRCGEIFTRGKQCKCDFSCLQHNECCQDFEAVCTTARSCQGRCGEAFKRGQLCECDPMCAVYNTCCQDYQQQCETYEHLPTFFDVHLYCRLFTDARVSVSQPNTLLPQRASTSGLSPLIAFVVQTNVCLYVAVTGRLDDLHLCSNSPINGLTALSNGTILIFKGELFWAVDPVTRLVGRPQSITDTLGVASPIDTVFTRPNCQRNTYIIKGDQYWRLDGNLVLEPGFPKPLANEFPGLTGGISAALAVPATSGRAETVFFFRNGFTKDPPHSPLILSTLPSLSHSEVLLSGEINIKMALKGFPTPVTSALSLENPQVGNGYQYYVFSGPLFFSVHISGNLPALVKPGPSAVFSPIFSPATVPAAPLTDAQNPNPNPNPNPLLPANSIMVWLRCA